MSDKFADGMREFGDRIGAPNRAARRKMGLRKSVARKQGWIGGSGETPDQRDPESAPSKQVQIQKPRPKGRPKD